MGNQKIAFITGASTGIGHASAKMLLANGFKVYATARRTHLMKDLEKLGAVVMSCDVTKDEDVQNVVDTIIKNEGRIDVLFANARFCLLGPVELQSIEDVRYQLDVNVLGNARAFTAVLPHMRKQKSGRIIITSSDAGHVGSLGFAWYPATKHAQQGVGDGLRMEVKEFGINPKGPASTSGLFLTYETSDYFRWGVNKVPVAAGMGAGPHKYDIYPGKADSSILIYRMNSTKPGVAMAEIGRVMIHKEGVELISKWINAM
jgi:NADP-dependent 3-hydroxy acid dehydrogenase YdfG